MAKYSVILSAERSNLSAEANLVRTEEMRKALTQLGFEFVMCEGCYEGSREKSFTIPCEAHHFSTLAELAEDYEQDSILLINECKWARIIDLEFDVTVVSGEWCKVPKSEALSLSGYTYYPEAGIYYVIQGNYG